ncbi:hypothetical protein ACJVC5_18280 [Peredibacter sp. HCB2-198]|uniref:hypothetical protein n=1 Tax=Peredibacter sp. HCB2-198 TaxID=3383025 RepID=UPI0038B460AE
MKTLVFIALASILSMNAFAFEEEVGISQSSLIITFAPSEMTSAIAGLKEEIAQVEPDAYAFLAGEEMTSALAEVIEKVRDEKAELSELSDEAIVSEMIKAQ